MLHKTFTILFPYLGLSGSQDIKYANRLLNEYLPKYNDLKEEYKTKVETLEHELRTATKYHLIKDLL